MNSTTKNVIIGSTIAIVCAAILIFSIESGRSLFHIAAGFFIFILPITFISSFRSKFGAFVFVFCTLIMAYLVSRFLCNDFWLGVLLAAIIGGAVFYFRTSRHQPFSASEYKQKAKEDFGKSQKP